MISDSAQPDASRVPRWKLGFGLGAAPLAWAAHGLASVGLSVRLCEDGKAGSARAMLILLSALALALALAGTAVAYRTWRSLTGERDPRREQGRASGPYLAFAGIFVGVVFTLAVLWGALPGFLVRDVCEAIR